MAAGPGRADERPEPILPESRPRRNAWGAGVLLALLTVGGALLRSRELAQRPLWVDEASFWKSSHATMLDKLAWQHHYEHPPLAYMVEGWTFQWLGDHPEWTVRLPSFLFGVACIPLAFVLGRSIGGVEMGLLAATLAAVDPVMVEQSRQARMYSQFEALLLITLTVVIRMARRRPPSRVPWIGLGVLEASLYWTSQAGLAAWAGQILGVWWLRRSVVAVPLGEAPAGRTRWGITWAAALLLSLPGLFRLADRLLHPILDPADVTDAAQLAMDMARTVAGVVDRFWGVLLLPLAILGMMRLWRERPVAGRILGAIGGANLAGLLVLRAVHPLLKSRYLVALFPSLWIGAASFVAFGPPASRARRVWLGLAVAGLLIGDLLEPPQEIFRTGTEIRLLARDVRPGDAVVYLPRFIDSIGAYYGVPRSPELAPHVGAPAPADLDGRRVWLVVGGLPAERYVREARDLIGALARRRGADARAVLAPVRLHYTGIVMMESDGRLRAFRPRGEQMVPDHGP